MKLEARLELKDIVKMVNIAEHLSEEDLAKIGHDVHDGFEADKSSRSQWEEKTKYSLDLALQVMEEKTFPWQGASNVKFPLVTIAAMQYHARAYPSLIGSTDIVKCRVVGDDPSNSKAERAERVAGHMSFQILEEDETWEEEMDKALLHQAIVGCSFKKTYFDSGCGHNVSEHILAKDLYVSYYTRHIHKAPRITQMLYLFENDMYERYNGGIYLDWNKDHQPEDKGTDTLSTARDKAQGLSIPPHDDTMPYSVLEQHTFYDLDGDGYKEPYIVTVREDTKTVLRIAARFKTPSIKYSKKFKGSIELIEPDHYFTKYTFIPSPDGGFYDLGFGVLLGPLNGSINTSINQLIDAGTLSVTAGGFLGRGVKFRSGDNSFKPFEWKRVEGSGDDLKKGIFPLPVREPSNVLFQLLSLLIDYGERIGMAVDPLVGKNPGQNTPAETSRSMVQEGQRVFNAVFKRTYRGMKEEFRKWYNLNSIFLEDQVSYFSISAGQNKVVLRQDYSEEPKDIIPAADPNMVSDEHKLMQAQMLREAASGPAATPGYNKYEVEKKYLQALRVSDIEKVFPDPKGKNAVPPVPNPKVVVESMKLQIKELDIKLKYKLAQAKLLQEADVNRAKIAELEAKATKELAEAKGVDVGNQLEAIKQSIEIAKHQQDGIMKAMDILTSLEKETMNNGNTEGGMGGMAQPPGDGGSSQVSQGTQQPNSQGVG